MGVIKRGILGGFSNKVANVVGSSWKGIAVIKSLPLSVANPNTASQQAQRGKFAKTVEFAGEILTTLVKPLWDRFAQQQSGYNAFIQANIGFFNSSGLATPASLITSRGSLTGVVNLAAVADNSAGSVTVTWDDNTGSGNASSDDVAYILVYNNNSKTILGVSSSATRVDGTSVFTGLSLPIGNTIYVYLAFRTTSGFYVSNNGTVSTTVVA